MLLTYVLSALIAIYYTGHPETDNEINVDIYLVLPNSADAPRPLLIIPFVIIFLFSSASIWSYNNIQRERHNARGGRLFPCIGLLPSIFHQTYVQLQKSMQVARYTQCLFLSLYSEASTVCTVRECWRCTNLSRHESGGQLRSQVVMNHNNWLIEETQYHWLFVCHVLLSTSVQYTYRRTYDSNT